MALSTQPYKGARDFYPEDFRSRRWMFDIAAQVVEKFGYERYDAPILEPIELYLAKTGEEIVNEQTYVFEDRGGRKVTIRPEMTPTVSRMVAAKRQELAYPLRWYSIPNLWRYERPQRGRLREHWQLNVDLFGIATIEAEHEMILIIDALMQAYGAKRHMYTIKISSRKLINDILRSYIGLDSVQSQALAKLIDRMRKISRSEFVAQADGVFTPAQRESGVPGKLEDILKAEHLSELPESFHNHDSIKSLKQLLTLSHEVGIKNVEFDITLMRGFDYYTDIVFEVFDTSTDNARSIFGGGRYDGLVGLFGVDHLPTIGFGLGDVTLRNLLEGHKLLEVLTSETDAYVVLLGDVYSDAQPIINELREMGLRLAVDFSGRKPAAQIKSAVKKGITYAIFIGEKELKGGRYTLKNLSDGVEQRMSPNRLVSTVKENRQK